MTILELFEKLTSKWMREILSDFQKVLHQIQSLCIQMWTDAYRIRVILILINFILSWFFHLAVNSSQFFAYHQFKSK